MGGAKRERERVKWMNKKGLRENVMSHQWGYKE